RLRQIMLNLLSNAVKFTEAGEVVLTVSAKPIAAHRAEITFSVRDTGIGLSAEGMARLFQSFSQADSSTTRKYGGTGLGLAISRRLAELMGGRMWAESEGPGKGSSFLFTIEADIAELPESRRRDFLGVQPELKGKRILVVDDNATNRRILALQTAKWGMQSRDTEFPAEALRCLEAGEPLERQAYDVVVMDVQMPELDGLDATRQICARHPAERRPKIVAMTANAMQGDREMCLEAGMDDYLTKPIRVDQLVKALYAV